MNCVTVVMAMGLIGLLVTILILGCSVLRDGVKETLIRFWFWLRYGIYMMVALIISAFIVSKGYGINFEVNKSVVILFTSFLTAFLGGFSFLEERALRGE